MKRFTILLIILFITIVNAFGGNNTYIISQQRFIQIMPLFQQWTVEEGEDFSEFSNLVFAYYPLSRYWNVTLRGSQAIARGDTRKTLNGITDTQLTFSYHLEGSNLVFNFGLNFPTGKKELNEKELVTSSLISNDIFNFQVPNFGQGFNVSPGLSWAFPVSEQVVLGFGASYQFKGEFQPFEGLTDYNPGDEILITGGIDLRVNETATISSDIIFTLYGTDKLDGEKLFDSGNKLVANVQFRKYFNSNELWVFARYRSRAKNEFIVTGEKEKIIPNQFEIMGHYRFRFNRMLSLKVLAEGRFYEETPATFSGIHLYGTGIAPEISFGSNFKLPLKVKFLFGNSKNGSSIFGLEMGLGLVVHF